jgi:uncharacterized protein
LRVLVELSGFVDPRVLLLAGSSGRLDTARGCTSSRRAAALSIRWFGGGLQPPAICERPLEIFDLVLDLLGGYGTSLGIVGTSKGAEASLARRSTNADVEVVMVFSPRDFVRQTWGPA